MKKGLILVMGLMASTSFFACKNDTTTVMTPITKTIFSAVLNGASEKPTSTTSPATGTFEGSLENTTNVLSYTLTYTGFPASSPLTGGHLHQVTPNSTSGVNGTGPVAIPFGSLTSPVVGTATLTQAKADSMKNGFFYANLHTAAFPAGAIRGNLVRQN